MAHYVCFVQAGQAAEREQRRLDQGLRALACA
jgi:hypothetical protein